MGVERLHLNLSADEAEQLSWAISDLLCWISGFEAGRAGTDLPDGPMGVNQLRNFNIKLKNSLKHKEPHT